MVKYLLIGLFSLVLGILAGVVSTIIRPTTKRHWQLISAGLVFCLVGSVLVTILPDDGTSSGIGPEVEKLVVSVRVGESTSLPRKAVNRFYILLFNEGPNRIVIDRISPVVFLGTESVPYNDGAMGGEISSFKYRVVFWDGEPPQEYFDTTTMLTDTLDLQFHGPPFPYVMPPDSVATVTADMIFEASDKTSWLFRGRLYPVSSFEHTALPAKNQVSVRFTISDNTEHPLTSPPFGCSVIEVPQNRGDFDRTVPRGVTGNSY